MKEKLEACIEHIKQVCYSDPLTQKIEIEEQIKAFMRLRRESHRPYETTKVFAIDQLKTSLKSWNDIVDRTSCDDMILKAYRKFIDIKINNAANQIVNSFERNPEEIYPPIDSHADDTSSKNHNTELFCLYLLSTFVIDRTNNHLLHDLLFDLLKKLDLLCLTIPVEVTMLAIDHCQNLLTQLNQLPGKKIKSNYTVPQLLVWGIQQGAGNTLDLTSNEVIFIYDEDKWQAIAKTCQLMKKTSITIKFCPWEVMADAFSKVGTSVETFNLDSEFSAFMDINDLPNLGKALKKMRVQVLNVSKTDLDKQTDPAWWESFCQMLKHGRIQQLNLSGNKLYLMSDELWALFCQGIKCTNLKSVKIDVIYESRMEMLNASLRKNNSLSGALFQNKGKTDTHNTSCVSHTDRMGYAGHQ